MSVYQGTSMVIAKQPTIYHQIDLLVQERHYSIADALELHLSCTNPSKWKATVHNWYNNWLSSVCLSLQWSHNGHDGISNYQPHDPLLNHIFRHISKKISKLLVTGLCVGNSPGTGEFPTQIASMRKMFLFHDIMDYSIDLRYHNKLSIAYYFYDTDMVLE